MGVDLQKSEGVSGLAEMGGPTRVGDAYFFYVEGKESWLVVDTKNDLATYRKCIVVIQFKGDAPSEVPAFGSQEDGAYLLGIQEAARYPSATIHAFGWGPIFSNLPAGTTVGRFIQDVRDLGVEQEFGLTEEKDIGPANADQPSAERLNQLFARAIRRLNPQSILPPQRAVYNRRDDATDALAYAQQAAAYAAGQGGQIVVPVEALLNFVRQQRPTG